jgi:hypothetical protein
MLSCVSNIEEELYPLEMCDTLQVSYSQTIAPILQQQCYECHGVSAPISGIPLEGYANLKNMVMAGRLLGALRRQPGFSPMPQNGPSLPECTILKIEKWVAEGALNN